MSVIVLGSGKSSGPLVPALSISALSRLPSRFGGGVWADTQQLGRVPSWGPEIGMLTSDADKLAVINAHLSAVGGPCLLWFCLYVHYQEDGVAYPDGKAAWNDFTANGFAEAVNLAQFLAQHGVYPGIQLGGDELGSAWVRSNIGAIMNALRAAGLQGRCVLTPTFDSDADGDWSAPGNNWAQTNLDIAAAIGSDFALANWLPAGWARLGYGPTTPVDAGEAVVNRWSLEGPGGPPSEFLTSWPPITGAVDDGEHGWVPVFTPAATPWMQFVQQVGRRVKQGSWVPPPDAPYNVLVDGHLVSCDENPPPTYSTAGQACVMEESFTYSWVHQNGVTPDQIDTFRRGSLACGCDATG